MFPNSTYTNVSEYPRMSAENERDKLKRRRQTGWSGFKIGLTDRI